MGSVLCTGQGGRKTSLLKCDFFSSEQLSSPPTDYIQMIFFVFLFNFLAVTKCGWVGEGVCRQVGTEQGASPDEMWPEGKILGLWRPGRLFSGNSSPEAAVYTSLLSVEQYTCTLYLYISGNLYTSLLGLQKRTCACTQPLYINQIVFGQVQLLGLR